MDTRFKLIEENFRYLFDNASDAIWVHDMDGVILVANQASEALTGYTAAELFGSNVTRFLSPRFLDTAREVRRKLLEGQPIAQPYEQQILRKDGTVRIMQVSTSPLKVGDSTIGFQHIARDVTGEKSAREMLSKITNGSPTPAFVIDRQHQVTHWNTAIEALTGIRAADIIGTDRQWQTFYAAKRPSMADLIVDGASAQEIEAYYKGKQERSALIEGAYEAEDFFPRLGESGRWLHFTASPIKSEGGETIAAIETLLDVTEERQLRENMQFYVRRITAAQEDERKRIARELHDEVSSSLLILIQRLDSMVSSPRSRLSPPVKERLADLRVQAVTVLEGVRRCAQDLRPRVLDDLGLVVALEWIAEDLEKNYGIKTRVEVVGGPVNLGAETQLLLFRIAQEAMSNIRRHSGASAAGVKLQVEDCRLEMTISDNGRGFELPGRTEGLAGVGKLGVLGMNERARLLGGSLKIASAPGRGTTVTAEVPLAREAGCRHQRAPGEGTAGARPGGRVSGTGEG